MRKKPPLADEETILARKRKATARWCRGKPLVEHAPELAKWDRHGPLACSVGGDRAPYRDWCFHRYRCTTCGKWLKWLKPDSCPDQPREEPPCV